MNIQFLPEALEYFKELSTILYEKDYFGFEESAIEYVDSLLEDIKNTLPQRLKKPAPPYFERYGENMLYSTFRKNKATHWYVFYNVYKKDEEVIYLIRYISNNHMIAQYL